MSFIELCVQIPNSVAIVSNTAGRVYIFYCEFILIIKAPKILDRPPVIARLIRVVLP